MSFVARGVRKVVEIFTARLSSTVVRVAWIERRCITLDSNEPGLVETDTD